MVISTTFAWLSEVHIFAPVVQNYCRKLMYMVNHIKDHIIQLLSKFHTGFQIANHPSSFTQSEKKKKKSYQQYSVQKKMKSDCHIQPTSLKYSKRVKEWWIKNTQNSLQWFRSYLPDRNQSIVVNNSASSPFPLMCRVPQGSVLGPVLFVLYTTPLSDIIISHSVNHQLFEDDIQL